MNKKAKKVALYGLLTLKAKDKQLCGLKDLEMKGPKTKDATSILSNLGLDGKKVLLVMNKKDEAIEKSFRNLQKVKYLLVDYLNPFDVMNADKVVLMESALEKINEKK
jgi:large subunit ribosomal protein L4